MSRFLLLICLVALGLSSCDNSVDDQLNLVSYLANSKSVGEQYAAKLKATLRPTDARLTALAEQYGVAQRSVNRSLQTAKVELSSSKKLSEITIVTPQAIDSTRTYLKAANNLWQSQSDEKGLLTTLITLGVNQLASLHLSSSSKVVREKLLDIIDQQLTWRKWEEL